MKYCFVPFDNVRWIFSESEYKKPSDHYKPEGLPFVSCPHLSSPISCACENLYAGTRLFSSS
jgi:hypothetical protein